VYRVHPIPPSLRELLFDFGGLPPDTEQQYIRSMIVAQFSDIGSRVRTKVARMLQQAQNFVRNAEGDHSSVSLRDVHRALKLSAWFHRCGASKAFTGHGRHTMSAPIALGLAHVFYFRLPSSEQRSELMRHLRVVCCGTVDEPDPTGFECLKEPGIIENVVATMQRYLCSKLVVEDGIALNASLMENLYVTLVCVFNRIPVFIVGKPGSSKTLTMQVLASNLQGEQSPSQFWRRFPAVHIFSYQCSPLSTAVGIQHQFDIACNYQKKARKTIVMLLLDEVGLAEHSPDMPLKVLHGILVRPTISIVGLSNWTLDAAKMNRAICLQRPTPSPSDIHLTGVHISNPSAPQDLPVPTNPQPLQRSRSGASEAPSWLEPLSRAYHAVYTRQKGRDFVGMRDYYQTVQLLRRELAAGGCNASVTPELLCRAVCRNFGGREDILSGALVAFGKACFRKPLDLALRPLTSALIEANLRDVASRHLMLLTEHGAAVNLLFSDGLVPSNTVVLIGSAFHDDLHDLYLIQHVNRVKAAMAAGETVILWNLDNIYESLYDVLNQRYVVRSTAGHVRRSLRLAIGARSQLCPVKDGFQLIVIVERNMPIMILICHC